MGLLDRVAMLVRANLNDLIDRSEDPEKMLKQVILDMQNQLMQVKTQVASAMADAHLLRNKAAESRAAGEDCLAAAHMAVGKGREDLARGAIECAITHKQMTESYSRQVEDQDRQVEQLKSALTKLEAKLSEARTRAELLIAQRRSARAASSANRARAAFGSESGAAVFDRMKDKVELETAMTAALTELAGEDLHEELASLARREQVERILQDLKRR